MGVAMPLNGSAGGIYGRKFPAAASGIRRKACGIGFGRKSVITSTIAASSLNT